MTRSARTHWIVGALVAGGVAATAPAAVAWSPPAPRCTKHDETTNYRDVVRVRVRCHGRGLRHVRIGDSPDSGKLRRVRDRDHGRVHVLTAAYKPDPKFTGVDSIRVDAHGADGVTSVRTHLTVLPWRMRTIGDSVTAGFGYFGSGKLMPVDDLLDCKPAAVVSNRCSSNSDKGPNYSGPPEWSNDFGVANNVSWAAQFANDWQGGGHLTAPLGFQNRAVTGSAPSDWLPGGILNRQLSSIVAQDPDLVAMTLGANPLLDQLLLTADGESCSFTFTVAELQSCIAPFFQQVHITQRLQQVYTDLLQAPDTEVVVFQYNLSIPSINLFSVWQLEAMIDYFNSQIADAVASTKAALPPAKAGRLLMISAQTDPSQPNPQQLPRFDVGLPPTIHDSWTPAFDCGDGDPVDGRSHQADVTQDVLQVTSPLSFCPGNDPWTINADSGIHPSRDGYAQYADTLANVAEAHHLIPPLP